eukprot:m51a1_g7529 hypothetical protein (425) ;mRNA; f:37058-38707
MRRGEISFDSRTLGFVVDRKSNAPTLARNEQRIFASETALLRDSLADADSLGRSPSVQEAVTERLANDLDRAISTGSSEDSATARRRAARGLTVELSELSSLAQRLRDAGCVTCPATPPRKQRRAHGPSCAAPAAAPAPADDAEMASDDVSAAVVRATIGAAVAAGARRQLPEARDMALRVLEQDAQCAPALLLLLALRRRQPALLAPRGPQFSEEALEARVRRAASRPESDVFFGPLLASAAGTASALPPMSLVIGGDWLALRGSPDRALALYQRAAEQKDMCGIYALARASEKEAQPDLYRQAAEMGHAAAQLMTARGLEAAPGKRSRQEAVRFYRLAADQGLAQAQHSLGACLEAGAGAERDEAEAVRYYRMAADQAYAAAEVRLAECLRLGIGGRKDEAEAAKWSALAEKHMGPREQPDL